MMQSRFWEATKNFRELVCTAVAKAEETLSEFGSSIKETINKKVVVHNNTSICKEQICFPWTGCENEDLIKEECLNLSKDSRIFLRCPPPASNFTFVYETSYPVAMAIMEIDPSLGKVRYELVPKFINEGDFWRNYFYHVDLICRSHDVLLNDFNKFDNDVQEEYEIIDSGEIINL